ncbi:GPI transamidase subunit PIG-U [Lipomyces oligophaga]|uniref:GPI transamidase subunit PIG-U n=1 Tax=Lipomyces oligophaga TaxID=45792 RepID=UPI0034CE78E0
MDRNLLAVFASASFLRFGLSYIWPDVHELLDQRVEVTSSATSFKQLKEGLHLYNLGISPYDGGVYKQSPLLLLLFNRLSPVSASSFTINAVYCLLDLFSAYALCRLSASNKLPKFAGRPATWVVAACFLFNPLLLITSLARSTAVISNTFTIGAIYFAFYNKTYMSVLFLAISSHINFYSLYFLPAFVLLWRQPGISRIAFSFRQICIFILILVNLSFLGLYVSTPSRNTENSKSHYMLQYLTATYGNLLYFGDLTPNMGLWWYFFMEIFDGFRPLFTYIFQLYSFIFVFPISIRLHKQPLFAIITIAGLTTISKSYPELGDLGVYLSLLLLYPNIFENTYYSLLSVLVILHALVLAPSFYHLWIYLGSGNANFFYAITLVYTIGVTVIISDTLRATLRIEFDGGGPSAKQVSQI